MWVPTHELQLTLGSQVRLSDIDILGSIGDSDSATFAARSTGIHTYFTGGAGKHQWLG